MEPVINLSSANASLPLEDLSDAQLVEMEGIMRSSVLKRLEFLQQIQLSINQIHEKLGQYQRVVEKMDLHPATPPASQDDAAGPSNPDRKGKKPMNMSQRSSDEVKVTKEGKENVIPAEDLD